MIRLFFSTTAALLLGLLSFSQNIYVEGKMYNPVPNGYVGRLVENDPYDPSKEKFYIKGRSFFVTKGILRQDTVYYPRIDEAAKVLRPYGFAVVVPANFDGNKSYWCVMFVHGVGERGQGRLSDLQNIVLGWDYDNKPSTPRQYPFVHNDIIKAVNDYQFIAIIPTYSSDLPPAGVEGIWNEVESEFIIDKTRRGLVGFSMGGGVVINYATASPANAAKLSLLVAAAPVSSGSTWANIANAKLQMIGITASNDPTVSPNNLQTMVDKLNALKPTIKPYHIIIKSDLRVHTGFNEITSLSNPWVPQNIYAYLSTTSTTDRRQYPTGTTTTPIPDPPTNPNPGTGSISLVLPADTSVGTKSYQIDGSRSKGYDWLRYTVVKAPAGVSLYQPMLESSGYIIPRITFPKEGTYEVELTLFKGTSQVSDTIRITYGSVPEPKKPIAFTNGLLIYDNGTSEPATVVVDVINRKTTITTASGSIINL